MNMKRTVFTVILAAVSVSGFLFAADAQSLHEKFKRGVDYTNRGDYDDAERLFKEIIEADPGYSGAYMALGIAYINRKMYAEAADLLERAVDLDSRNRKARFILAKLYEKMERDGDAIRMWKGYLDMNPERRFRELAEKHLKRLRDKVR